MMDSYDGAELCELMGIFTQSVLQGIINKEAMGLYRDDELVVLKKWSKFYVTGQKVDKIGKKII